MSVVDVATLLTRFLAFLRRKLGHPVVGQTWEGLETLIAAALDRTKASDYRTSNVPGAPMRHAPWVIWTAQVFDLFGCC
jgi:hypothetical protein